MLEYDGCRLIRRRIYTRFSADYRSIETKERIIVDSKKLEEHGEKKGRRSESRYSNVI